MALKIVATGMPRPYAEELIRRLVAQGDYFWGDEFKAKLIVRNFTMTEVIETLKGGSINQGPQKDQNGDWRCRVRRRVAGRLVRVVVAICDETSLDLISVH